MKIALVGNPNCGKTTLFNAYTGSSQYVGNWPGVTVEKKEGKYKKDKKVHIMDLPGVYSLSPYTSEEVITRDYLLNDKPDVIINIIDATNLERNLYLTTQVLDMNIPTVIALNRIDMLDDKNSTINEKELEKRLGVPVVPIIATKKYQISELMSKAIHMAKRSMNHKEYYTKKLNELLDEIGTLLKNGLEDNKLFHSIKVFENDKDAFKKYEYEKYLNQEIKNKIDAFKKKMDDDGESIIINEKYEAISKMIKGIYTKKVEKVLTTSDKIDKVITNKWLGLPIFFGIMWFVYYVSIQTIGDKTIGWVEQGVEWLQGVVESALTSQGASEIVISMINDGIIGSLGAIFTFVPQLMILFLFLSILEDSGYMARVAFIMDRIFRKFGLSGKSFIPMIIGTGCSIPGIMATRTIENEADKKMTILLTPFVPCSAKLPVFAMFIAFMFPEASWVGPSIYLIAFIGIVTSGILLKKTRWFAGEPAPFIMELPPYTVPTIRGILLHMWDRAKGFIKKAGTIIFLCNLIIWTLMHFDFSFNYLADEEIANSILAYIGNSIKFLFKPLGFGDNWAASVATFTGFIAKEMVVSTFATVGAVAPLEFTQVSAFSFIIFTIFASPCFAAIGAMRREFNNFKFTAFAMLFQTGLAYVLATLTNQIGSIVLKGTSAMKKIALDYNTIGEFNDAEEFDIIRGDIFGYVVLGLLAVSVLFIIYNLIFKREKSVKQ